MLCNLSHRTIDDRAKREKCIVLLRALQFCSQLNARRSTMQSVWSDLSKTETRRLHLTSHPCYNMKQAMCSQGHRSLSLPVSLAHRTTLLIYYKRGGFDVGLCVPISTLLWQEGARRPVIGCLQQAGRLRSDWLLLLCVCARRSFALAATGDSALTVRVCLLQERTEHNRRRLRFIFICSLWIYVMVEHNTAGNYADIHCSIIVSVNVFNTILPWQVEYYLCNRLTESRNNI